MIFQGSIRVVVGDSGLYGLQPPKKSNNEESRSKSTEHRLYCSI